MSSQNRWICKKGFYTSTKILNSCTCYRIVQYVLQTSEPTKILGSIVPPICIDMVNNMLVSRRIAEKCKSHNSMNSFPCNLHIAIFYVWLSVGPFVIILSQAHTLTLVPQYSSIIESVK